MGDVIRFPFLHKRPHLIPFRPREPIELSADDLIFQQAIRDQGAELRALRNAQRPKLFIPNFSRFWQHFSGVTDCGNPTGSPIDE